MMAIDLHMSLGDGIVRGEEVEMIATQSEAHYEWHYNAGTQIWVDSGCPWDACGLADGDYPEDPIIASADRHEVWLGTEAADNIFDRNHHAIDEGPF